MRSLPPRSESNASLGRITLVRVARARATRDESVREATAPQGSPWSRGLWGVFLPDRRAASRPVGVERRR